MTAREVNGRVRIVDMGEKVERLDKLVDLDLELPLCHPFQQ